MNRNNRDKQGFTLAELLVVVAIIAVLVAIAIPIFTSQLEKSREATDAANIRSQYAQVMTDAITEGGNVNGKDVYGAINLNQKKENWQDTTTGTNLHGLFQEVDGHPVPNGTAWVEYKASESKVILHYEGEGSSNGGSSSGGSIGGNSGSSGDENNIVSVVDKKLNKSSIEWKKETANTVKIGEVYMYKGVYYISLSEGTLNAGGTPEPDGWYVSNFVTPTNKIYTSSDTNNGNLTNVVYGDIYVSSDGSLYISKASSSPLSTPDSGNMWNWVKILVQ